MIKIGFISYLNAYPFYYPFQFMKDEELIGWKLVVERPGVLNKMLRNGELDISLISFMEYATNPHLYELVRGIGLSSKGYVDSVKLFSKIPIHQLSQQTIYTTNASATSVAVMEILLRENGVKNYHCINYEAAEKIPNELAVLSIGDEALTEETHQFKFTYDLGEMWNKLFGRNIVFAVCAVRKDSLMHQLPFINSFLHELVKSPTKAFANRTEFANACQRQFPLIPEPMAYLDRLSYAMGDSEVEDIRFFLAKAFEHKLLPKIITPEFFTPALEFASKN
jgi:chorismate dehydratase